MKKNFEAPVINVSFFETENIITASGDMTAVDNVKMKLNAKQGELNIGEVRYTLTI